MKSLFLEAPYLGEVKLSAEVVEYLQKYKKIGLFASIQFIDQLDEVKKQLKNIKMITSKPPRAKVEGQLLGCNTYSLNMEEVDAYLYLGDGKFHPLALVYGQKDLPRIKEVIGYDPIQKEMNILAVEDVKKSLKRYRGSLMKFLTKKNAGVIITIKPGQEQYQAALKLEKKYPDKKFYYFIDNNVSFDQLENFPFIEVWVNCACPRIALDSQEMFRKGVVNLNDAIMAKDILSKESVLND